MNASRDRAHQHAASSLGAEVRSAVGGLYRRFRSEREEGVLGDSALDVLLYLSKSGPQSLTFLSQRAGVVPASMSQSVNRLTSAGYAVRTPDLRDRRKVLFATTPEGDLLAEMNRSRRDVWLDAQLEGLSTEERETISDACRLLNAIASSRS